MKKEIQYTSSKEQTVKQALKGELHLTRKEISRLKFNGSILLNGTAVHVDARLQKGDVLHLLFPEEQEKDVPALAFEPKILYEDEDVVLVNKPSGIPVHASHGHLEDSLGTVLSSWYRVKGENFTVRAVGRLDKDVSGVMVYAKNRPAAARLNADRQKGVLKKTYQAFAQGVFAAAEGRIESSIQKGAGHARVIDEEGKPAVTEYRVLRQFRDFAWIEVSIRTGRTHQIRAHMASIGHPLLGDALYGGSTNVLHRSALHCARVVLLSPFSGVQIEQEAPLPLDLLSVLKSAEEEVGRI